MPTPKSPQARTPGRPHGRLPFPPSPSAPGRPGVPPTLDGISRELVWALALRRVARGRVVNHSVGFATDHGRRVPGYVSAGLVELIDCGLVHDREPLQITELGRDVLADLICRRRDLRRDRTLWVTP